MDSYSDNHDEPACGVPKIRTMKRHSHGPAKRARSAYDAARGARPFAMPGSTLTKPSICADDELLGAAQAARRAPALKPAVAGQLSGLVIGMLAYRQLKPLRDAIVADRVTRKAPDEGPNLVEYGHVVPPCAVMTALTCP